MLLEFLFPSTGLTAAVENKSYSLPLHVHCENTSQLRARSVQYVDELYAACSYHNTVVQQLVRTWKYNRIARLHTVAADCILQTSFPQVNNAVLCPVPLHWTRKFWRGFNQAHQLALHFSQQYHLPVCSALTRVRPTGHQAHRNREERFLAMENAFICSQKVDIHTIVLCDDVATTCATLDACAKALKQAGVQRVIAWTLAFG